MHGLAEVARNDPWRHGRDVATRVQFYRDGRFEYFCDDDSPMRFLVAHLNAMPNAATYTITASGDVILDPFGVSCFVARHPENWGFVLVLPASVWTSFPMPRLGEDAFLDAIE